MSFKSPYVLIVLIFACLQTSLKAQENLEVKGLSFFKNMAYEKRLAFLQGVPPGEPAFLDAAFLEDSAYLLLQQLKHNGYLKPKIEGVFEVDGISKSAVWENEYTILLDTDFLADHATFYLQPGVLYYYDSIEVSGVPVFDEETIRRYFKPEDSVLVQNSSFAFTEGNLKQRIRRLLNTSRQMGYRRAQLLSSDVTFNDDTGAVAVDVSIELGPLHRVGQVVVEWINADGSVVRKETEEADVLLTKEWELKKRQALRSEAYRDGYADAEIVKTVNETMVDDKDILITDVHYQVKLNSAIKYGGVKFLGDDATKIAVLERLVKMSPGDPLNPFLAAKSRRELMGLGIFKEIEMRYEPENGLERTVVYDLTPAIRKELDLLVGWGSYELIRAGFNWSQKNPFGRAHRYELSGKQSLRSTNLETTYSIPRFLGSAFTAYTSAEYSFREEISFDRTKQGVAAGLSRMFAESHLLFTLEYGYSREDADREPDSDFDSNDQANVGSVSGKVSLDRRDNFLAPERGYSLYSKIDIASELLGGTVAFQKIEGGASYHTILFKSFLLHLGFRAGAIFSESDALNDIPFTERFFNGGENTVRGYQQGEASPLDSNGKQIGAESFTLFNMELEKSLFQSLSFVIFLDTVTNWRDGYFESEIESLSSAGMGLRYQTVVGPIRLEYGHNLNPRASDPDGTLHFSIGYPF